MKSILAVLLVLSVYGCDYPEHYFKTPLSCEKTDIQMNFGSENYSHEKVLDILKISEPSDYRYYFNTFVEELNKDKMLVNFRDERRCLDVLLTIDTLGKLKGMKETNGKSYPKELFDLQWRVEKRNGKLEAIYSDMHDIID